MERDTGTIGWNETAQAERGRSQVSREPMTGAQAAFLKMLAEDVREPAAFAENLSKREASRRIDALTERLRLCNLPPHTD